MNAHRRRDLHALSRHASVFGNQSENVFEMSMVGLSLRLAKSLHAVPLDLADILSCSTGEPVAQADLLP